MTPNTAQTIASALRAHLYNERRNHATDNAQDNLGGRTHYADAGTLRFHKSRILSARPIMSGAFFLIIESCALDMHNTRRGFRAVLFDLLGEAVYRPKLEECRRTREQASADFWSWCNQFDELGHYRDAMNERARDYAQQICELSEARAELAALQEAAEPQAA
jgi:hypothetical protein